MRKILFLGLALVLIMACQNKPERYTTSSPNIDVVKKLVADYHAGDWEAWLSNYADTAKIYHNNWSKGMEPEAVRDALKELLANTSKYHFDESEDMIFYEEIIDDDGATWVNFWGNWEGTLAANNQELEIPVHLSCLMKDGKIISEYGFYNLSEYSEAIRKIEAKNNMPIEEKAANATADKFINGFLNNQNTEILNEVLADDYVRYMNDVKVASSREELSTSMNAFFKGFPDFKITNPHRSALVNNIIFVHWEMTGTHKGDFNGIAPTGKKVKISGLSRVHFNGDGKIDEENVFFDQLNLMQQLGKSLN